MTDPAKPWDGALVRRWLERRVAAARLDQAAADRRGYEARDDYDKAAAEEWVCQTLLTGADADTQEVFAKAIKALAARDEYRVPGINDDTRFERHLRAQLRKLAKMTKENTGFANTLRFQ